MKTTPEVLAYIVVTKVWGPKPQTVVAVTTEPASMGMAGMRVDRVKQTLEQGIIRDDLEGTAA